MYQYQTPAIYSSMYTQANPSPYGYREDDERFLPLLLPFVAGLAIGPLLFNRPYPYPPPPPYPYPPYPGMYPYPGVIPGQYPIYGGPAPIGQQQLVNENINIFTQSRPN